MKIAANWTTANRLILRGVLTCGFSFLLRSSEFLSRGGAGWDNGKVLRGKDFALKCDGRALGRGEYHLANELAVFLRSSKADQYNEGAQLVHHIAGPDCLDLCCVRAVRDIALCMPERFEEEAALPLFRWEGGEAVTRNEIRKLLGDAAVMHGVPYEVLGLHSLRSGGASALYQASGGNIGLVKRLGRWQSEAFEGYIWEDRELTRGLASAMIRAPWHVHAASY